jgi:hypothetical protein
MHLHLGEFGQDVGRVFQLDPVILDVLARGEVAVAAVVLVGAMSPSSVICAEFSVP